MVTNWYCFTIPLASPVSDFRLREVMRLAEHVDDMQQMNRHLMASTDEAKASIAMHQKQLVEMEQ